MKRRIKAALIDFDGVLVDTDRSTIEFYNSLLAPKGLRIEEHHLPKKVGRKSYDFLKEIFGDKLSDEEIWEMIELKRKSFVEEMEKYVFPIEDGIEMVKMFKDMGLKTALVSGNSRKMIEKALKVLGMEKHFDCVIAWEDVENKKPHPECYFRACELLRVSPEEAVVIEDSETGILGASNANMLVATVKTPFNLHVLDKAHVVCESFREIPLALRKYLL